MCTNYLSLAGFGFLLYKKTSQTLHCKIQYFSSPSSEPFLPLNWFSFLNGFNLKPIILRSAVVEFGPKNIMFRVRWNNQHVKSCRKRHILAQTSNGNRKNQKKNCRKHHITLNKLNMILKIGWQYLILVDHSVKSF